MLCTWEKNLSPEGDSTITVPVPCPRMVGQGLIPKQVTMVGQGLIPRQGTIPMAPELNLLVEDQKHNIKADQEHHPETNPFPQ